MYILYVNCVLSMFNEVCIPIVLHHVKHRVLSID